MHIPYSNIIRCICRIRHISMILYVHSDEIITNFYPERITVYIYGAAKRPPAERWPTTRRWPPNSICFRPPSVCVYIYIYHVHPEDRPVGARIYPSRDEINFYSMRRRVLIQKHNIYNIRRGTHDGHHHKKKKKGSKHRRRGYDIRN